MIGYFVATDDRIWSFFYKTIEFGLFFIRLREWTGLSSFLSSL